MKKDNLFVLKGDDFIEFNFGKDVADVFDDMLGRSVPLYQELQRMIGEISAEFAKDGTNVYDLGCSTGTTLMVLDRAINKNVKLVGVDYSQDMLNKGKERLCGKKMSKACELIRADLNKPFVIENASVVLLNLTLQFVRPLCRDNLIRQIFNGLVDKGCLILVEKVLGNNPDYNQAFVKFYYDMKRRHGYSELEIARKREALENVLIPYRVDENSQLLIRNGFASFDIFYKWHNFCGIMAAK